MRGECKTIFIHWEQHVLHMTNMILFWINCPFFFCWITKRLNYWLGQQLNEINENCGVSRLLKGLSFNWDPNSVCFSETHKQSNTRFEFLKNPLRLLLISSENLERSQFLFKRSFKILFRTQFSSGFFFPFRNSMRLLVIRSGIATWEFFTSCGILLTLHFLEPGIFSNSLEFLIIL